MQASPNADEDIPLPTAPAPPQSDPVATEAEALGTGDTVLDIVVIKEPGEILGLGVSKAAEATPSKPLSVRKVLTSRCLPCCISD